FQHAMGAAAQSDPAVCRRTGRQDHGCDRHHRHGSYARLWRHFRRLPAPDPNRVRSIDRVCGIELLPGVLLVRWRSPDLMDGPVEGFAAPVHRALTEPILLGGAPRAVAIVNGTVAAALG